MRRRLEIARGLIHYPKLLFLDEPTIGLDPQTRDHIWVYIKELRETRGITIVLTTHYMEEADRLSDRVGIIDYGKIVALDTPVELKRTLEGDVITVRVKEAEKLYSILSSSVSILKSHVGDGMLELTVRVGEELLPRIVEIAAKSNINVQAVVMREPSLEDVFLHYTGRAIRPEGGGELRGEMAVRRRAVR
jgi:ABC-2 type transport system ATP-binding protein